MPNDTFQDMLQEHDLRLVPLHNEYERVFSGEEISSSYGESDDIWDELIAVRDNLYDKLIASVREQAPLLDAAGELLAACEELAKAVQLWLSMRECECEPGGHHCGRTQREKELRRALAAIAKARGETVPA